MTIIVLLALTSRHCTCSHTHAHSCTHASPTHMHTHAHSCTHASPTHMHTCTSCIHASPTHMHTCTLMHTQEDAVIRVVDGVMEDIRLGLELNVPKMNQRRVSGVKFLGELYNYQLVESNVIFRTLYMFLSFGCNPDGMCVCVCVCVCVCTDPHSMLLPPQELRHLLIRMIRTSVCV